MKVTTMILIAGAGYLVWKEYKRRQLNSYAESNTYGVAPPADYSTFLAGSNVLSF